MGFALFWVHPGSSGRTISSWEQARRKVRNRGGTSKRTQDRLFDRVLNLYILQLPFKKF